MSISRKLFLSSLIVVAVFAFGFGLAFVEEAQADQNYCCTIQPTVHCNAGVGVSVKMPWGEYICVYDPTNEGCLTQVPPECF